MARHHLSPQAEAELDEIWLYVTEHSSVGAADGLIDRLTDAFLLLAGQPYMGRSRDELREGYRSLPLGEYVIFYRIEGEDVLIVRVLHGRRDIGTLL
jgi:plasmid stabilization system protein ParE